MASALIGIWSNQLGHFTRWDSPCQNLFLAARLPRPAADVPRIVALATAAPLLAAPGRGSAQRGPGLQLRFRPLGAAQR